MKDVLNNRIIPFLSNSELRKVYYEKYSEEEWSKEEHAILTQDSEDIIDRQGCSANIQLFCFSPDYVLRYPEKALILVGRNCGYTKEKIIDHLPDLFTEREDGFFEAYPYENGEEAGAIFVAPNYAIFPEEVSNKILRWFDQTEAVELVESGHYNPVFSQLAVGKERIIVTSTNSCD